MPDKLTDNEIVKALECCIKSKHFGECFENDCPLVSEQGCKVGKETLYPYALNLINRQKAEIERLKKSNRNWRRKVQRLRKPLPASYVSMMVEQVERQKQKAEEFIANLKSEAYKEFAERLKERFAKEKINECYIVIDNDVDNILKELVGDIYG